jgi:hypothetical protein
MLMLVLLLLFGGGGAGAGADAGGVFAQIANMNLCAENQTMKKVYMLD